MLISIEYSFCVGVASYDGHLLSSEAQKEEPSSC